MTTPQLPAGVTLDELVAGIDRARDGDLERLADAMIVGAHLGDLADHLIGHYVDEARRAGRSWTEIGQSMGVSKQAARKRFNPKDPGTPAPDAQDGFGNFTGSARSAVIQAQEEARASSHTELGAPHLLLGVLRGVGAGDLLAEALDACGASVDDVASAARAALPPAGGTASPTLIPFDEPARKVLELAFRQALRLEHAFVGPEHIVLALLEQEGGAGPLSAVGLTRERLEPELVARIGATLEEDATTAG